jgi:dCMP deaminase
MTDQDHRFLATAERVAKQSKDPSTKVGCVVVSFDRCTILGEGHNSFPRGVDNTDERWNDRPTKYLMVQHAELNAVLNCVGSTVGATVYVTYEPCASCAGMLIQAGVQRIVTYQTPPGGFQERFAASFKASHEMLSEAGVDLLLLTRPEY